MNKGDRVEITKGKNKGVKGEIFWKGPNKYGSGDRFGIRGDDGATYWAASDQVEGSSGPAPKVEPGETFDKGDRVRFRIRGREGTGSVFWIGKSKNGPGQRLGIDDDDGEEAVWLDARLVQRLAVEDEPIRQPAVTAPVTTHQGEEPPLSEFSASYEMPPMNDGPPMDYYDQIASDDEPADEDVPPDLW